MTEYMILNEGVPLPLSGNWKHYGGDYGYATVSKDDDLVTINGLIQGGNSHELARLPEGYRPPKSLLFNLINNNINCRVDVHADGVIEWRAGSGKRGTRRESYGWVSLSGISFSTTAGTDLPLLNGWENYGAARRDWGHAKYTKTSTDIVTLSGLIKGGDWGILAQLPEGFRPQKSLIFNGNNNNNHSRIDIHADGTVEWRGGGAAYGWVSLSGISFTLASEVDIPLVSGINFGAARRDWGDIKYKLLNNGLVNISGMLKPTNDRTLAILPPSTRPDKRLIFCQNSHNNVVRLDITEDGDIVRVSGGESVLISLSGVQFYSKYKTITATTESAQSAAEAADFATQAATSASDASAALSTLETSISQATALTSTVTSLYDEKKHAIVSITSKFGNSYYSGTGFIIKDGSNYYICTVAHNVVNTNRVDYADKVMASVSRTTGEHTAVDCTVIGVGGYADIAILKMDTTLSNLTHLEFASENSELKIGHPTIVVGDPLGVDTQSFSQGHVRDPNFIYANIVRSVSTTASVFSGNSGSPMVDMEFNIRGIISYGMNNTTTLSWGAHSTVIKTIADHIISNYNPPTTTLTNYIGGTLQCDLQVVDGFYATANNNSALSLEGYYVYNAASNSPVNNNDIIKKIENQSLGVYESQITPSIIYTNKNQPLDIHINNSGSSVQITPSELSLDDDIYLGANGNIDGINVKLIGPKKIKI